MKNPTCAVAPAQVNKTETSQEMFENWSKMAKNDVKMIKIKNKQLLANVYWGLKSNRRSSNLALFSHLSCVGSIVKMVKSSGKVSWLSFIGKQFEKKNRG